MFLSLRRHDPDQVRRVSARRPDPNQAASLSQPLAGAPLGLPELSAECRACVKRAHSGASEAVRAEDRGGMRSAEIHRSCAGFGSHWRLPLLLPSGAAKFHRHLRTRNGQTQGFQPTAARRLLLLQQICSKIDTKCLI